MRGQDTAYRGYLGYVTLWERKGWHWGHLFLNGSKYGIQIFLYPSYTLLIPLSLCHSIHPDRNQQQSIGNQERQIGPHEEKQPNGRLQRAEAKCSQQGQETEEQTGRNKCGRTQPNGVRTAELLPRRCN